MRIEEIAIICHEVNRAYCLAIGDPVPPAWDDAPEWQRASVRMGVDLHMMGDFGPEASHLSWMKTKLSEGWTYGPVKDVDKKTHPCLVSYENLPKEQQAKDHIFRAIVRSINKVGIRSTELRPDALQVFSDAPVPTLMFMYDDRGCMNYTANMGGITIHDSMLGDITFPRKFPQKIEYRNLDVSNSVTLEGTVDEILKLLGK